MLEPDPRLVPAPQSSPDMPHIGFDIDSHVKPTRERKNRSYYLQALYEKKVVRIMLKEQDTDVVVEVLDHIEDIR